MNPVKKRDLRRKIDAEVKTAVAEALEEHRRAGRQVAVLRDGQIVKVLPEPHAAYEVLPLREEPPHS